MVHNLMLSICCYSGSESPKLLSKFHFVKDHLTERRDVRSIVCKSLSLFRFYLFISVKINVLVHYVLILCFCCQCYSQLAVDFLFCLVLIEVLKQVNKLILCTISVIEVVLSNILLILARNQKGCNDV